MILDSRYLSEMKIGHEDLYIEDSPLYVLYFDWFLEFEYLLLRQDESAFMAPLLTEDF